MITIINSQYNKFRIPGFNRATTSTVVNAGHFINKGFEDICIARYSITDIHSIVIYFECN